MKFIKKICLIVVFTSAIGVVKAQQHRTSAQQDTLRKYYIRLLKSGKKTDSVKLNKDLLRLSNSKNEQDLQLSVQLYDLDHKPAKADSLIVIGIKRFPRGELARIKAYNNMVIEKPTGKQEALLYSQFIKNFPETPDNKDIIYDDARSEVSYGYALDNNAKSALEWLGKIKDIGNKAVSQKAEAELFLTHSDTATAEQLYRYSIQNSKKAAINPNNRGSQENYFYAAAALANLLYAEKKYSEAMTYAKIAYDSDKESPATIQSYALALSANGRAEEALPLLANLVINGKAGAQTAKYFETVYIRGKGSDDGFKAYYQRLADERLKKIKASLVDKDTAEMAPAFAMKDIDGNTVTLAELKGNVVILDFWATWCGPCKRSFPAMQMAMNKYTNDPNVRFLFIDTWEKTPDPANDVRVFLNENKYSFRVLMDDTKTTNLVGKFGISGIPAKFVIDGRGFIRFRLTGFEGDNEAAVDELSAMIDMAKKQPANLN